MSIEKQLPRVEYDEFLTHPVFLSDSEMGEAEMGEAIKELRLP